MAIKLKGEAQQYELEDLIGYLSDPELINDRLSSFDLSDRIKELSVIWNWIEEVLKAEIKDNVKKDGKSKLNVVAEKQIE